MGALKFGLIGLLILCPFLYLSYVDQQMWKERDRYTEYIKHSLEEATYDAAFAIKEFSTKEYSAQEAYRIRIPYQEVVQVFFESFTQREVRYTKKDFPALIFLEEDGIVSYLPEYDLYLPKRFYPEQGKDAIILQSLEAEIQSLQEEGFLAKDYDFLLPTYGNESYGKVITDLCILCIYENDHFILGEKLRFFNIIPSGVLKKEISY